MPINLPVDDQHIAIVGANGSGKTQAALYHLSLRNWGRMPWVVYNWKRDRGIDSIPGKTDLELNQMPEAPGVHVVHPIPKVDDARIEDQMWRIWERGETGVYVDEGYMVGRNNDAFH